MRLTPSFDNVFPMDAASELVSLILAGLKDQKEAAQATCCLLCYATNFLPTAHVYTGILPLTADDCGAEIVAILKPVVEAPSTNARTSAALTIPWAQLLALLVQLLALLKQNPAP